MIDKIKDTIAHYWSDHKTECFVFAILIAIIIVK
jgi:hypothetical protein